MCIKLITAAGFPESIPSKALRHFSATRLLLVFFLTLASLNLSSCGGAEDRKAKYLQRGREYLVEKNYEKAIVEFKNVLQIDPKDAKGNYYMGVAEEADGNHRRAFAFYNKAIELNPDHVDAKLKLARYYIPYDPEKALNLNQEILDHHPENPDAMVNLALLHTKQGDQDSAIKLLNQIITDHPANTDAPLILSSVYAKRNNQEAQESVLERAAQANPDSIDLRLGLSRYYLTTKKFDLAERQLQRIISIEPESANHRQTLAAFYTKIGDSDKAEITLRENIANDPDDQTRYLQLAAFLLKQRGRQSAIDELNKNIHEHPEFEHLPFNLARLYAEKEPLEAEKVLLQLIDEHKIRPPGLAARNQLAALWLQHNKKGKAIDLLKEVLDENPRDNQALLLSGTIALKDANGVEAVSIFRSLLRDYPDNAEIHGMLADALLINNAPQLAVEHMEKSLALKPEKHVRRLKLAKLLARSKNYRAAIGEVDAVLKKSPKDLNALKVKSSILASQGDRDKLEETLKEIKLEYPDFAAAEVKLGQLYFSQQQFNDALNEFEDALDKQPESLQTLAGLVDTYLALDSPKKAEARLRRFVTNHPKNAIARTMLGRFYVARKRYPEAIKELKSSLEMQPSNPSAMALLLATYSEQGQPEQTIRFLKTLVGSHPKHPIAYSFLGQAYFARKQFEKAKQAFEKGININPGWEPQYIRLADIYLARDNIPAAIKVYGNGLSNNPDSATIPLKLAETYQLDEDYDNAIEIYQDFVKKNPGQLVARNNLASLIADHRDDEESLKQALAIAQPFKQAQHPNLLDTLGWIYLKMNEIEEALPLLTQAAQQSPQTAVIQYHLGAAYYKQGENAKAKQYFDRALDLDDDFDGADNARKLLQTLRSNS